MFFLPVPFLFFCVPFSPSPSPSPPSFLPNPSLPQCLPEEFHGFGYLVPSREREDILGVVFDSLTFPGQHAGPDLHAADYCPELRLTVMMGGAHHPGLPLSCFLF